MKILKHLKPVKKILQNKNIFSFVSVTSGVIMVDRITKWIVKSTMELHQTIPVLGDFFTISYILNSGIAFGLFDDNPSPLKTPLLIVISFIALGVILYIFFTIPRETKLAGLSMGLIFGGAIGNMIDRIIKGEVIDFFDVDFPDINIPALSIRMTRFPTFNVADSGVLIGIVMLLIIIISHGGKTEPEKELQE